MDRYIIYELRGDLSTIGHKDSFLRETYSSIKLEFEVSRVAIHHWFWLGHKRKLLITKNLPQRAIIRLKLRLKRLNVKIKFMISTISLIELVRILQNNNPASELLLYPVAGIEIDNVKNELLSDLVESARHTIEMLQSVLKAFEDLEGQRIDK